MRRGSVREYRSFKRFSFAVHFFVREGDARRPGDAGMEVSGQVRLCSCGHKTPATLLQTRHGPLEDKDPGSLHEGHRSAETHLPQPGPAHPQHPLLTGPLRNPCSWLLTGVLRPVTRVPRWFWKSHSSKVICHSCKPLSRTLIIWYPFIDQPKREDEQLGGLCADCPGRDSNPHPQIHNEPDILTTSPQRHNVKHTTS
ncbi:uncharacterized protein LOC127005630 [Eriocheir sinensis]|uniref:uncharacterized protein LOC127005630 n=1 Tax=Eriocheir sinensis TaxID=95602 RepID=UPI0021C8A5F9|nr:uncharacterized protein LOC127005630 [Eriocheir sinensis]